jgi:hypothetical protein
MNLELQCGICLGGPAMIIWRGFSLCEQCVHIAWHIPRDVRDRLSDVEFERFLGDVLDVLENGEEFTDERAIDRVIERRFQAS